MGFFLQRQRKLKTSTPKRDINEGIYPKCESCKEVIAVMQLSSNLEVCPTCGFHHRMTAKKRLESLIDPGSFKEINRRLHTLNPLNFPGYEEKIEGLMEANDLNEAVVTGIGKIAGESVAIGIMDSHFLMASMGSVVGEKVTRLIEVSISRRLPLIMVCASGGARMQEGIYSLMQMAKTSAALAKHNDAGLLYISVLTHPTMGGVTASFATLGDIIIAEKGASVGFAGRRVVEQTIKQKLPDHFQTAEFLQEKGLVDLVVSRQELKQTLAKLIDLHEGSEG